jgi:3-methyladenine DNA glycosylase/8-oxoguanine DNA glycosylase
MESDNPLSVLNVSGPYREPRETAFSYDFVIHRPKWPSPHAVRVKVSIPDELDYLKDKVLSLTGGTPGQQLLASRTLIRHIADRKLEIADNAGMLSQRLDVMIQPFTQSLVHLFPELEAWMKKSQEPLRQEIKEKIGF